MREIKQGEERHIQLGRQTDNYEDSSIKADTPKTFVNFTLISGGLRLWDQVWLKSEKGAQNKRMFLHCSRQQKSQHQPNL